MHDKECSFKTKEKLINNIAEEMFGDEKIKNNKKISRILMYMSLFAKSVTKSDY